MSKSFMLMCVAFLALLSFNTVSAMSVEAPDRLACRNECFGGSFRPNCYSAYLKVITEHYTGCFEECMAGIPFDPSRKRKVPCKRKKPRVAAYELENEDVLDTEDVSQYEVDLEDEAYELEDFDSDSEAFEVELERSQTRDVTPYSPYY